MPPPLPLKNPPEISGIYTIIHHATAPQNVGKKAYIRRVFGTNVFGVVNETGTEHPGGGTLTQMTTGELVLSAWGGRVSLIDGVTIFFPAAGTNPAMGQNPAGMVIWRRTP